MENFKDISLIPKEEELYQQAIKENPELTREQFKEIRSGAIKNPNTEIHMDKGNVVAELDESYLENRKER